MPPEEPTPTVAATPAADTAVPAIAQATILTPTPAPAVVEPVAEVPVVAEVVAETPVAEAKVEVVAETTEKPAEPATEPKPASHTDTETLLEKAGKPDEKPKTDDKPAEGEKPTDTAAEAFKYEPFTLPEGLPIDEARINAFTELVAPHKLDQETAQKLVDLHVGTLKQFQDAVFAKQQSDFIETRRGWVDKILQDPVLGGAGHQTALMAAARMRDLLVPEPFRTEFAAFMRDTGAGDHPALMRLFHNAARLYDEPAAPPIPARPVPDRGGSAKQPRQAIMYDHPTSRKAAGR